MRSHFIEGLKSDVQLQLIAQDPIEDLGELYHTAINITLMDDFTRWRGNLKKLQISPKRRSDLISLYMHSKNPSPALAPVLWKLMHLPLALMGSSTLLKELIRRSWIFVSIVANQATRLQHVLPRRAKLMLWQPQLLLNSLWEKSFHGLECPSACGIN